jgi:aminoglycoside phosphotransferase (APT) family kinase protein
MSHQLTWLPDGTLAALRLAIAQVAPELADRRLLINERVVTTDPRFFQGSAVLDGAFVVKFAWSESPARRIVHEGVLLVALASASPGLRVPRVVATSANPALLITVRVPGGPLTTEAASGLRGERRDHLVGDLADFLAVLHRPAALAAVQAAGAALKPPEPQADTDSIRARFGRFIEPRQRPIVAQWCDWVDAVLVVPTEPVLLHGDLHGHNMAWDEATGGLRLVADFEAASLGDSAYDFRYLPGQADTNEFFLDVAAAYEQHAQRRVPLERVMAWHIRTALGDALWRSEARVALPGGGTPASWVDDLAGRMRDLGCMR